MPLTFGIELLLLKVSRLVRSSVARSVDVPTDVVAAREM
jgi:hypothetical protein